MMLQPCKERPRSKMLGPRSGYHSNGFDVARIASYKSELRRLSERFYVRVSVGGECGGGVGLRRCFLVRDLRGGVWRVQHRGHMGGLQAVRQYGVPKKDGRRIYRKNGEVQPSLKPPEEPQRKSSGYYKKSSRERQR